MPPLDCEPVSLQVNMRCLPPENKGNIFIPIGN